jgi:hypothetical protein
VTGGGAALPSETARIIRKIYRPASKFRIQESDPANMWPLNAAWRAVLGQCAPSPKHAATRLPPAGLLEAHAEVLCRRRQWFKNSSVVERPPQSYGQRLELVESISPRGLTYHRTAKAGYMYSSPLHICRVVLLLLRQRRGAGLVELLRARGRSKYNATAPAHTQCALHGAQSSRGRSGKST